MESWRLSGNANKRIVFLSDEIYNKYYIDSSIKTENKRRLSFIETLPDGFGALLLHDDLGVGSVNTDFPILTKAKHIPDDENRTVISLNPWRHLTNIKKGLEDTIEFKEKRASVVWRGTSTGEWSDKRGRKCLVDKYHNHKIFNIGFGSLCQGKECSKDKVKGKIPIEEQLKYKYIIAVKGNDESTGIKWMLGSKSVVMSAPFVTAGWINQGNLKPWKHFVPLKEDYSDLEEKFVWCEKNQKKCIEISKNAREYVKQFRDMEKQKEISKGIIKKWCQNVTMISKPGQWIGDGVKNVVRTACLVSVSDNPQNLNFHYKLGKVKTLEQLDEIEESLKTERHCILIAEEETKDYLVSLKSLIQKYKGKNYTILSVNKKDKNQIVFSQENITVYGFKDTKKKLKSLMANFANN